MSSYKWNGDRERLLKRNLNVLKKFCGFNLQREKDEDERGGEVWKRSVSKGDGDFVR